MRPCLVNLNLRESCVVGRWPHRWSFHRLGGSVGALPPVELRTLPGPETFPRRGNWERSLSSIRCTRDGEVLWEIENTPRGLVISCCLLRGRSWMKLIVKKPYKFFGEVASSFSSKYIYRISLRNNRKKLSDV